MYYKFGKIVVIALGGSIMFPDKINWKFLKNFKSFIENQIKKTNRKFIVVTGGGRICRMYQEAAGKITDVTDEDKDWIGIHSTRCNAQLLRTIFKKIANPVVYDKRYKEKTLKYQITIASGWQPGWSTDYIAVALAQDFKAGEVIMAGKPDHVYNKDPKVFNDAKPFDCISWTEYRKLIPEKWIPGFHAPVDPIAAKLAEKSKIKTIIIDGRKIKNFENLLIGKDFQGTIIS